jgi:phage shock protein PspC (stress-responsive transcriptional regulator)
MRLTVNINLAGYAFHVDEDAYLELKEYLRQLETGFSGQIGAAEIIADIEGRMAELFAQRLHKYKQVIAMQDLDEVMVILGSPAAISGNGDVSSGLRPAAARRFYRDPDGRMIGGVCAGIAAYFAWNPLLIRILFALLILAGGFGLALYLVLWVVLPEAITTAQKLEMRGDPVTIANITRLVKSRFETVKKKMKL